MKNKSFITFLSLTALSLTLFGCSQQTREETGDKAAEAYQASQQAIASTWDDAKEFTFEKSRDFQDRAEAMSSQADAKIEKLQAQYAEEKASASRSAAWNKLQASRATLTEKMAALGNATAATWDSAKADVIAAGKQLEASYDDFVADNS